MRDDHEELTSREHEALANLPREATLPLGLEDRVVAALRERGVLRAPQGRRTAAVAVAILLLVALAYVAGRYQAGEPAGSGTLSGQTFALLILDPIDEPSEQAAGAAVSDAVAWARDLAAADVLLAAEKLRDEAQWLELRAGTVVTVAADPDPRGDRRVGGFFLIRAASYEEAREIAAGCPLLRYGSVVEIRAVD